MKNLRLIVQDILLSGHIRWAKKDTKDIFINTLYFYSSYNIIETHVASSIKIETTNHTGLAPTKLTLKGQSSDELNFFYNINKSNVRKKTKNRLNQTIRDLKQAQISVISGYKRMLRVKGVGYKFNLQPDHRIITIEVGYSYLLQVNFNAEFYTALHNKSTELEMRSHNILKLTSFLSKTRKLRVPDVYKGKGIRYKKDPIHKKEGKKKKSF